MNLESHSSCIRCDQAFSSAVAMESYLRLPANAHDRRQILRRLKAQQVDATVRYLETKCASLDVARPHFFMDRYEEHGQWHTFAFEVQTFNDLTVDEAFATMRDLYIHHSLDGGAGLHLLDVGGNVILRTD